MIEGGATHIAVATDHVIESFRNGLWTGYKTGAGVPAELMDQFPLLEEGLVAMGVAVWAMTEYEADDALAAGAQIAARDPQVDRVLICTPDKDLSQCVRGTRVVQFDRRKREIRDESGVVEKFGVMPPSIPDYLALVGDTSDGYPGLRGWGAKSASLVLARFEHLESIPADWEQWKVKVPSPRALAETLQQDQQQALLFRDLATLRTEIELFDSVEQLRWTGVQAGFPALCAEMDASGVRDKRLPESLESLAKRLSSRL